MMNAYSSKPTMRFAVLSILSATAALAFVVHPSDTQNSPQAVAISPSRTCVTPAPPGPVSDAFCSSPPVVQDLSLTAYTSAPWFQTHFSGSAARFSSGSCTTANYTLTGPVTSVAVLNCAVNTPGSRPSCGPATATPREGSDLASKLSVLFPGAPRGPFNPGRYNVAAITGSADEGYTSAAVYTCFKPAPGAPGLPGFFILARNATRPDQTLAAIKEELTCAGYNVDGVDFMPTRQTDCKYFFGEEGFSSSARNGGEPTGPPPSAASMPSDASGSDSASRDAHPTIDPLCSEE